MSQPKTLISPETAEFENLIEAARIRSKKIRIITLTLIFGLICIGVFLTVNSLQHKREEAQREGELRAAKERQRDLQLQEEKLRRQAQDAQQVGAYLAAGANKAGRGHRQAALEDYDKALALQPENPDALSLKGYLLFRMDRLKEGRDLLEKAVQNGPTNPWNHYNFALALWATGSKDDAIAQLQEVLKLDKSFRSYFITDPQFIAFKSDARFRTMIK